MAGIKPAMTSLEMRTASQPVMAGLVPAIHVFTFCNTVAGCPAFAGHDGGWAAPAGTAPPNHAMLAGGEAGHGA